MQSLYLPRWKAALRYHDLEGSGPPVLFLHGLGCSASSDFPAVAADSPLRGRRRLLIDLLGGGFSDKPLDFPYTIEAHAETVIDLLIHLDSSPVDLFGHSMGGSIAITIASLRPELVNRLVVAEPNLDPGGGLFSRRIAAQPEGDYLATGHARETDEATSTGNTIWAGTMAVSSPHAVYRAARSLIQGSTPSWRDQLLALEIPKTVLFGEHSLPDPDTKWLPRQGIPVLIVPNAGHSMMWENPHGVATQLAEALN